MGQERGKGGQRPLHLKMSGGGMGALGQGRNTVLRGKLGMKILGWLDASSVVGLKLF